MKVFFSGSRNLKEEFSEWYQKIIAELKSEGLEVIDNTVVRIPKEAINIPDSEKQAIYKNLVKLIDKADISVFEASYPSTIHIGHEITLAIEKGKPVVILYSDEPGHEPMLFRGLNSDKVIWVDYNGDNLTKKLADAIDRAKKIIDVRFNFFVSPKILNYLDWVAQNRKLPRSVFLRDLIEKEMRKDKEYKDNG